MLNNKTILITGGTGSFGRAFLRKIITRYNPKKVIIFSRDELKQSEIRKELSVAQLKKIRFFIGDVRDQERLNTAFSNVDIVIHAAALKQVDAAEYNPLETIKTNINGAQNVILASLNNNVEKILALSTDKACSPINLYGATKLASDKLFVSSNGIKGDKKCRFSVLRYGNVMSSRGSVIPYFQELAKKKQPLPVTSIDMTRFSLTLSESVDFAIKSLQYMVGGEIFVPKISSYKILDLVEAVNLDRRYKVVGVRPGEKNHEELISLYDLKKTIDFKEFFIIVPESKVTTWNEKKFKKQNKVNKISYGKVTTPYTSNTNKFFLTPKKLRDIIKNL